MENRLGGSGVLPETQIVSIQNPKSPILFPARRSPFPGFFTTKDTKSTKGLWEGWDQIDLVWDENRLGGSLVLPESQIVSIQNPQSKILPPATPHHP